MKFFLRKYYPLFASLLILFAVYFTLLVFSINLNNGHLIYSLDDAYIHMAMAKNLALEGVWGVSKNEFASCSSSILWTSLLGMIYYISGVNEITPLILNLIFASSVIIATFFILRNYNIKNHFILPVLIILIITTPLPPLMITGLEHVLHILISILFIFLVSEIITANYKKSHKLIWLLLLAAMLPAIRYEGIFLVFIASVILFLKRKFFAGTIILIFSLIPIFIFGLISVNNGWSFFPNSLLLKGSFPDIMSLNDFTGFLSTLTQIFLQSSFSYVVIIGFAVIPVFLYLVSKSRYSIIFNLKVTYLILMFSANVFLYSAYSKSGWSYRYQSFLLALYIVVFSVLYFSYLLQNYRNKIFIKSALMFLIVLPLFYFTYTGVSLILLTPQSTVNIYEQQYQTGIFLHKYYTGKEVALNDIGASNYLADIKCLDLYGLGNLEISQKRRSGNFDRQDIRYFCEKYSVKIAVLYDSWYTEKDGCIIPPEWKKISSWTIKNNISAGDSVISFYALNETEYPRLAEYLKEYSGYLPENVIEKSYILNK